MFIELNNEFLGIWNKWGLVIGGMCIVYFNEGGEWVWYINICDLFCFYICEYIVFMLGMMMFVDFVLVKKVIYIKVINRKFKKFFLIFIFLLFIVSF